VENFSKAGENTSLRQKFLEKKPPQAQTLVAT
jgi:hypothetical protein